MDNSNRQPMNRQIDSLGINKLGKAIAKNKSPLHQPNFPNPDRPHTQPHVYNIDKNDFRNIVQQLTGSPSREPPPRPPQNNPKPPNHRLHRVRPPPLAPSRPRALVHPNQQPLVQPPYQNGPPRPLPSPPLMLPPTPNDVWSNTAESPVSAYMRYLQNSIMGSAPRQPHPGPPPNMIPSPRFNGPPPLLTSPRMSGPPPPLPSPRMNGLPPLLPSPTSQFLLPSPTGFSNLLSPRSPYPLLSPGYTHPPPASPNFSFGQVGILGPGPPHPPPSPGYGFPSPGFFNISSPRWRDQ